MAVINCQSTVINSKYCKFKNVQMELRLGFMSRYYAHKDSNDRNERQIKSSKGTR